jgi:hypothetical protein
MADLYSSPNYCAEFSKPVLAEQSAPNNPAVPKLGRRPRSGMRPSSTTAAGSYRVDGGSAEASLGHDNARRAAGGLVVA